MVYHQLGQVHREKGHEMADFTIDRDTECWVWHGSKTTRGYPLLYADGGTVSAPRHYYEGRYGPTPKGWRVGRLCGNRACVNPAHGTHIRGQGRLTFEDAEAIRAAYAGGEIQAALAHDYNVSQTTISNIVSGKTWLDTRRTFED